MKRVYVIKIMRSIRTKTETISASIQSVMHCDIGKHDNFTVIILLTYPFLRMRIIKNVVNPEHLCHDGAKAQRVADG